MSAPDRVVWKYTVPVITGINTIATHDMPAGARFLACAAQHGNAAMWFEIVGPDGPRVSRTFRLFGTGVESIPGEYDYVGTTLHYDGSLVLHIYEKIR